MWGFCQYFNVYSHPHQKLRTSRDAQNTNYTHITKINIKFSTKSITFYYLFTKYWFLMKQVIKDWLHSLPRHILPIYKKKKKIGPPSPLMVKIKKKHQKTKQTLKYKQNSHFWLANWIPISYKHVIRNQFCPLCF